jgi:23S rRNA (uracil1939-C5)-methyltransferase
MDLVVERLGIHGEGVSRLDGLTIFVDGALPQEVVEADIYEQKKHFARARTLQLLKESPHRVQPPCPLFGRCGGCQLMHLNYEQQLEAKRARIVDALQRIAKLDVVVAPCLASPKPFAYRNKIQLPLSPRRRLGLYAFNTHELVEIDNCPIHCDLGEKVMQGIQQLLLNYPEELDMRHLLIKTAMHTGQVLVILVTQSDRSLTGLAKQIMTSLPQVKGVVQNINSSNGNTILSTNYRLLAGQGWIEEQLNGLLFKVSPASFFQVNPIQAELLYKHVVELAHLAGKERVLDAYCGVGTLALILAKNASEVIGIDSVVEAIDDARDNARRNQLHNARFIVGLAEEQITTLEAIDVAILNPPRKGCAAVLLDQLVEKKPKRIIYISCDPATLARDLKLLHHKGYQVESVQPLDMFPQTMHVECIVSLRI